MKIKRWIAKTLFKWHGWTVAGEMPPEVFRCVFVFAPHTSNWDFYFGVLCMMGLGVPVKLAIKQFWVLFPFSLIIKPLGGVGIKRKKKADGTGYNQVEMMAEIFKEYDQIALIIAPEASRSIRKQWKTGFFHVAEMANVSIVTLRGDYAKREVEFGPVYKGKENLDKVMRGMMTFFSGGIAKYPEKSSLDERYVTL